MNQKCYSSLNCTCQRQHYSLSGYFHISSNMSLDEFKSIPLIEELKNDSIPTTTSSDCVPTNERKWSKSMPFATAVNSCSGKTLKRQISPTQNGSLVIPTLLQSLICISQISVHLAKRQRCSSFPLNVPSRRRCLPSSKRSTTAQKRIS
jgi:hypothetical protein